MPLLSEEIFQRPLAAPGAESPTQCLEERSGHQCGHSRVGRCGSDQTDGVSPGYCLLPEVPKPGQPQVGL